MQRPKLKKHVKRSLRKGKKDKYYFIKYRGTAYAEKAKPLPDDPDSIEFLAKWREYMGLDEILDFTFSGLIEKFKDSQLWAGYKVSHKNFYKTYLKRINEMWGTLEVESLRPVHVLDAQDKMAKKFGPSSANNFLTTLQTLISWGIPREYANFNPCDNISPLATGEGYLPWSDEAIAFWRENAPAELVLVMEYALHLGQRQADILKLEVSDYSEGAYYLKQNKGKKHMWVPLHPDLVTIDQEHRDSIIVANADNKVTSIHTNESQNLFVNGLNGKPWTINSFKSQWNTVKNLPEMKWFKEQGFVFHGLRKNAVVNLLEVGCTSDEVKAITGHETTAMIDHYGKGVNQRKQAKAAIAKMEDYKSKNK